MIGFGVKKRTWAAVDLDLLVENYAILTKNASAGCRIMAVIKADAYGHGAPLAAKALQKAGATIFGVSSMDEAVQLRKNGIDSEILILGHTLECDIKNIIEYDIIQTIFSLKNAKLLSDIAVKEKKQITIHIKVDTGMNRLGFKYSDLDTCQSTPDEIKKAAALPGLNLQGIFTHFANSGEKRSSFPKTQFSLFTDIIEKLAADGIIFKCRHACNSAAFLNYPEMHLDMARVGLLLYGHYPEKNMRDAGLRPCMQLFTTISQIHKVNSGESVSYDRTYRPGREITAATLPIGYADGFSRLLSNSSSVIVGGSKVPVIGRICMDQSVIDVTGTTAAEGDVVTIFGSDGGEEITVESIADMMETINYEVICLIGKRVPRVYIQDGKITAQMNYINSDEK